MATLKKDDSDQDSLSKSFDKQLKIFYDMENSSLETNSSEFQKLVLTTITHFEKATLQVSQLGLFSSNEVYEEISTDSLKFLLLPVLLASLSLKKVGESRIEVCRIANIYFRDFLRRCKEYKITNIAIPVDDEEEQSENESKKSVSKGGRPTPQDLQKMSKQRENKIQRYKDKKSLENKLKELKVAFEKPSHDEDVCRDYFLTTIRQFIFISLDELDSLSTEMQMLKRIDAMRQNGQETKTLPQKKGTFKPFLITKDAVQKEVFGAGYPSLAILSVDELYEQRVRDGVFPSNAGPAPSGPNMTKIDSSVVTTYEENELLEKETKEENDDEKELERLRERDEWRDTHRTGWGNTYNRS